MKIILLLILFPFNVSAKTLESCRSEEKLDVPSLIPLPQKLQWNKDYFSIAGCKSISIGDTSLQHEAELLQTILKDNGFAVPISNLAPNATIELSLGKIVAPQFSDEAYTISVDKNKVLIVANSSVGIFNAIQTFRQLMNNANKIKSCEIEDWPAFAWRGYMVDVGRNFQSMDFLKRQIDLMASYKLNIFQFHFTEDIAWRVQSKLYPQLTEAKNMIRNKGKYYTVDELKELIDYCNQRHITLIPEIDMPGHSAAFKRAMGVDMQSDSGLAIIKNILTEFCTTYDFPYLHIGGDEVKITNKNFMPEVIRKVHQLGKKTIAWSPGAPLDEETIRQLWMGDEEVSDTSDLKYIDSRHLYLNHIDPLEAVVTIFNRQIADRAVGDQNFKGAILCMWPDRRVENEIDILRMNPVYPGIIAFSERVWRGGAHKGWVANVGVAGSDRVKDFTEFENRLLEHKKKYYSNDPFPYVKQTEMKWDLFGPYENGGDVSKEFPPGKKSDFDLIKNKPVKTIIGGTVILRHWWAPLIEGAVDNPKENTTWYAHTRIWSEADKTQNVWIGFNNLSRSPATDSPKRGTWDNHGSKVWVNGHIIEPPTWINGGKKGDSETPLIDEGYEYRDPSIIQLKKGWNDILIKAPIQSFRGKDWQNPEKWMFTFVLVNF